jgi:hypothetical protein
MRSLAVLVLLALMFFGLHQLLKNAGITEIFTEMVVSSSTTSLQPQETFRRVTVESYKISLLRDPMAEKEEVKIYKGTMKKSFLDRLEWIAEVNLDFPQETTPKTVRGVIRATLQKHAGGANVAIIDFHETKSVLTTVK